MAYEAREGDFSMEMFKEEFNTPLTDKEMALALIQQGSESEFFNLTPEGERIEC